MRRLPARPVYFGLSFVLRMPTWVVMAVYLVQELHFSPLQLVLMGTAMEAAVFLFEIPTGVVADTYSRRLSLIVGYLGTGLAWLLVGVVSDAWLIIALWALWGFFYTFTSGAEQAWITDEVGMENVGTVFLRGASSTPSRAEPSRRGSRTKSGWRTSARFSYAAHASARPAPSSGSCCRSRSASSRFGPG